MALRLASLLVALWVTALGQAPSSGIDRSSLDESVRPQDDLFSYVNARWIAATPMPPDRVSYGTFMELADRTEANLRVLIEEAAEGRHRGAAARQIGDLYASITDERRIEALGDAPIRPELAKIDAVTTPAQLAAEAGFLSSSAAGGPFGGNVSADARYPGARVAQISQGGTLLPDRDYYLNADAASAALRQQYVAYLAGIFGLAKRRDPAGDACAVMAFETELARARIVILLQPSFFKRFAQLAADTPLGTLKAWLVSRYVTAMAPHLSHGFDTSRFEFFGRVLTGQELPRTRWKRGVSLVSGYLGDAVGRLYVGRHFPAASKQRVEAIVAHMRVAFGGAIDESDWMAPPTKREAREKLSRLAIRVGYPDAWHDYRDLVIKCDDLFGNIQRAQQFQNAYRMRRIAGLTDPGEWLITPQAVNAYYAPVTNEIVLPAAVLQPPLFDASADDAVNYGAIGAVLGHEMAHAFDERGRASDGDGRTRDWWTPADVEGFAHRVAPLVAQFNQYEPIPGMHVNGALTRGENIGDVSGLAIAYRAYKLSLGSSRSPVLGGFTGEQHFFLAWARAWRGRDREEYLRQILFSNQHAPWQYRANGPVSNFDPFYDAFGVKSGDRLYRPPGDRVRVW